MKKKSLVAVVFSALLFSQASCGHVSKQQVSRSMRTEDIVCSKETVHTEKTQSLDSDSWLVRVTDPEIMQNHPDVPQDYDFSLSFKDDMLVADYGKQTVGVYLAKYDDCPELVQFETWNNAGAVFVVRWSEGDPIPVSFEKQDGVLMEKEYVALQQMKVLENKYSVQTAYLSDFEDTNELVEALGVDTNTKVLCWEYDISDFPWNSDYFREIDNFQVPSTLETIKFIPLSAQYIEGVPVRMPAGDCPTILWSDNMGVYRPAYYDPRTNWGRVYYLNDSLTCATYFDVFRYSITKPIQENLQIIQADKCLSGIKNGIMYNAYDHLKASPDPNKFDMRFIWESDVVVYCMELAYAVLDPCPFDQYDDSLESHELIIVPVWNAYYTATNSKVADEEIVYSGTVMVNAVTGDTIYSERYGPRENDVLYPPSNNHG